MENQPQKTYADILNVVCKKLEIKKRDILSTSRESKVSFARALYVKLANDLGMNLPRAVILINKSRVMMYHYLEMAENELKCNRDLHEHYKECCKHLGIEKNFGEPEIKEIEKKEAVHIRRRIGELKPNNHYTLEEEIAIERAKEDSVRYMRNYGKGVQPLLAGHAITRKSR